MRVCDQKHNPRFGGCAYTERMADTHSEILAAGLQSVQEKLLDHITQPKSESGPPGEWAKSYSARMKAEADAQARLAAHNAKVAAATHTRYEDMPPPTPEDEARFDAEFQKLLSELFDEDNDKSGAEGDI